MPRAYVRKKPRVTHASERRSETKTVEATPVETGTKYRGLDNEDPRFPGLRTVIVPKDDPRDAMHMSPVGAYQGMGYKVVSEDTKYTHHAGHVLMAIDVEEYNKREEMRLAEHNSRFVDGYTPDIESTNPNDPLKFYKEGPQGQRSGVKWKPNHNVQTHAQIAGLRGH